jgi:hypothetical protein
MRTAGVTVSSVCPETLPDVAVIVVDPGLATPVARPFEPVAVLIVAADGTDEVQVTEVVTSAVDVSE